MLSLRPEYANIIRNGEEHQVRPEKLKIGDLVTQSGGSGVVFYVSDSKVKIVSVTQTSAVWSSAKTWCSSYGTDWYLPTLEELRVIYNNKSTINSTLSANGYTTLGTGYYWSSTKNSLDGTAYGIYFSYGSSENYTTGTSGSVRAILAF